MPEKLNSLLELFRVKHWVKNLLIFFPLIFTGNIRNSVLEKSVFLTFILFSLTASAVYVLNDLIDVKHDRLHEKKKMRPIASGVIKVRVALAAHIILLSISWVSTFVFLGKNVLGLFIFYYAANIAYSFFLKKHPPLDIIVVALFYLIRPIIGAAAIAVPVSNWLVLTTFFAALYLVSLKRFAELTTVKKCNIVTRHSINLYTLESLKVIGLISLTVALVSYGLYASTFPRLFIVTIIPLTALGLRFVLLTERNESLFENPETIILKDRMSFGLFGVWLIMVIYYHWQ